MASGHRGGRGGGTQTAVKHVLVAVTLCTAAEYKSHPCPPFSRQFQLRTKTAGNNNKMKIAVVLALMMASCLSEASGLRLVAHKGGVLVPKETPEVAEARAMHEDAMQEARDIHEAALQEARTGTIEDKEDDGDEERRMIYGSADGPSYGLGYRRTVIGYGSGPRLAYGGLGYGRAFNFGRGLREGYGGLGYGRRLRIKGYGGLGYRRAYNFGRGMRMGYGGPSYGQRLRMGYGGVGYGYGRRFKTLGYSDEEAEEKQYWGAKGGHGMRRGYYSDEDAE
jgi:hypothetical protein